MDFDVKAAIETLAHEDLARCRVALMDFYAATAPLVEGIMKRLESLGLAHVAQCPATIGIAVWPWRFELIEDAWSFPARSQVPPQHRVREIFLTADNAQVDILTPSGAGHLWTFLEKNGEGLQQIELLTSDVETATAHLRVAGLKPLNDKPVAGADGTKVNFLLMDASPYVLSTGRKTPADKVLLELVER
ncbi:MAG: VOC family protein [Elusimicrobiota bacterium]